MKNRILILSAVLAVVGTACVHKALVLESKSATKNSRRNDNPLFQRKIILSEDLRNLQVTTHELESKVYGGSRYFDNRGMWGVLKACHEQLSQFADGKLKWIDARKYVIPDSDNDSVGLDEESALISLSEEYFKDRLSRFRQYKAVLEKRHEDFTARIRECKTELQSKQGEITSEKQEASAE